MSTEPNLQHWKTTQFCYVAHLQRWWPSQVRRDGKEDSPLHEYTVADSKFRISVCAGEKVLSIDRMCVKQAVTTGRQSLMQVKLSPQLQPCCSLGQMIESGKSRTVSGVDSEVRARYLPKLRQESKYPKPSELIDLRCNIHPMRMQKNQLDLRH